MEEELSRLVAGAMMGGLGLLDKLRPEAGAAPQSPGDEGAKDPARGRAAHPEEGAQGRQ